MRKPIAVVINWYGPYTYKKAIAAAKRDFDDGIYVALGRQPFEKKDKFQYIGIANNLHDRLLKPRDLYDILSQKCILWLGESATTGIPGKRIGNINPALDLAEWAHIFFLKPPLNDRKSHNPPKSGITVVNRWLHPDYETRYKRRPHPDWPDLIDYWGYEYGARLVRLNRTLGRIEKVSPEELE
ncbi:MAG: hypothetical protein P9X24_04370 [Candidatus Hatepunaea meridiana]|nr:hypothetical protein [Candidatus Hatepunaea meridiana]